MLAILVMSELLGKHKILVGEYQRKFVHIPVGTFIAFWPWLMGWRTIQLIALAILVGVLFNRRYPAVDILGGIRKESYGDFYFALIILLVSLLTTTKIFFCLAVLHMSLADGLAAVTGNYFAGRWHYALGNQAKTLIGSMTFWLISLAIFGVGLLLVGPFVSFQTYMILLVLAPPVLTVIENISIYGLDNLAVPLSVLLILHFAQKL